MTAGDQSVWRTVNNQRVVVGDIGRSSPSSVSNRDASFNLGCISASGTLYTDEYVCWCVEPCEQSANYWNRCWTAKLLPPSRYIAAPHQRRKDVVPHTHLLSGWSIAAALFCVEWWGHFYLSIYIDNPFPYLYIMRLTFPIIFVDRLLLLLCVEL